MKFPQTSKVTGYSSRDLTLSKLRLPPWRDWQRSLLDNPSSVTLQAAFHNYDALHCTVVMIDVCDAPRSAEVALPSALLASAAPAGDDARSRAQRALQRCDKSRKRE